MVGTFVFVVVGLVTVGRGQESLATFRSTAEIVRVPVWVADRGRPVQGLAADDFILIDNGVEQPLELVTAESHPVDVTLLLDTSGSITASRLESLKTGVGQIASMLQPSDHVRLLTFADAVREVFDGHPGSSVIDVWKVTSGGETSFYDALGAALLSRNPADRPHMIFAMSDGLDTMSFADVGWITKVAEAASALLYIALVEPDEMAPQAVRSLWSVARPTRPNIGRLRELAERTGGLLFQYPEETSLPTLFHRVLQDFRTSYLLSYVPTGIVGAVRHEIAVQTKNRRYTVRARKLYIH